MADSKITALTALTAADPANDMIPIVDVSDTPPASGNTKRISINNILACSPSATLASATISGDLTVDTNTLKVDSANDRVGIGTASPAAGYKLDVRGILAAGNSAGTIVGGISFSSRPEIGAISNHNLGLIANNTTMHLITPAGVFDWYDGAGGTRMTLNANGLGVGVVPSAGKGALQLSSGINFPATQVASSDANTLDDYEEGTWTPTIKGTGTAGTGIYSVQVGTYTKVGRVVHFQGRLTWSAHTGTGDMQIAGIPFTSLSTTNSNSPCNFGYINNLSLAASSVLTGFVFPNTNDIGLYQYTAGGGVASAVAIDIAADIIFSGTYFA